MLQLGIMGNLPKLCGAWLACQLLCCGRMTRPSRLLGTTVQTAIFFQALVKSEDSRYLSELGYES